MSPPIAAATIGVGSMTRLCRDGLTAKLSFELACITAAPKIPHADMPRRTSALSRHLEWATADDWKPLIVEPDRVRSRLAFRARSEVTTRAPAVVG